MAGINMDSIMKKVNAYAKSSDGKERMDAKIGDLRKSGSGKTDAGSRVTSFSEMRQASEMMRRIAKENATAHKLPQSVLDHFDSLVAEPPYQNKQGQYVMDMYFRSDLSRPSLTIVDGPRKGQRTGGGIDNIVSLFDTGYVAHNTVFGIWEGHESLGEIQGRIMRDSKGFMNESIQDFNRTCGKRYGVTAVLSDEGQDADYYLR